MPTGGNPIELHLLFVPECELTGRHRSRGHRGDPGRTGADCLLANARFVGYAAVLQKHHEQGNERPVPTGVVRVFPPPGAWPSLIGKGASATPPGSTSLRTRSGRLEVGGT